MRGFHNFFISFALTCVFLGFLIQSAESAEIAIDLSAEYQTITTADLWTLVNTMCERVVDDLADEDTPQEVREKTHNYCVMQTIVKVSPIPLRSI